MKKFTLLLLCILVASASFAQVSLEDFDGLAPTIGYLNGPPAYNGAQIIADPTGDGNTNVLEVITAASSAPWQQAELTLQGDFLDMSTADKTVSVYYFSTPAIDVMLGISQNPSDGAPSTTAEAAHPGGGWATLDFDFNFIAQAGGIPTANDYQKLFFFPLWNITASDFNGGGIPTGSTATTSYIDLIEGPAPVAATCFDGILNQDETGIDCGGLTCAPCAVVETCTDGIQNNGETDVDCGGPNCTPCNPNFFILEDFEGTPPTLAFANGPGSATVVEDPTPEGVNNGDVLQIITAAGSAPWQQAELTLQDQFLDLTTANKTVFVEWYSLTPFDALLGAAPAVGDATATSEAAHPGGGWVTLEFDFNIPAQALGVPSGVYQRLFFFNLWDISIGNFIGAPGTSAASTTYVDIIQGPDITGPGPICTFTTGNISVTCDTPITGTPSDHYSVSIDFTGGLTVPFTEYYYSSELGGPALFPFSGDDPNIVESGTIIFAGIPVGFEGVFVADNTDFAGTCTLVEPIAAPICIPPAPLDLLEDFEGTTTFTGAEGLGAANVVADPLDGLNTVGQIISSSAGNPWQNANVIMQDFFMDLTTTVVVQVDVYATQDFTMLGKVENLLPPGAPASGAQADYVSGSGWQTLTFTFDMVTDDLGLANGEYSQIGLFPNWAGNDSGNNGDNPDWNDPLDFTVYVDNIRAVQGDALPVIPVNYVYNNGWAPSDPTGVSGAVDNIIVIGGDLVVSADLECGNLTIQPGASMTIDTGVTMTANETTCFSQSALFSSLIVNGSITGTVIYQRFTNIVGVNDLASPPLSGQTFGSFATDPGNGNLAFQGTERAYAPYNTVAGEYQNYDVVANAGTIMTSGVGYRAATIDGNRLIYTGTPLSGDVLDVPITDAVAGKAWNLIGNPYSSYMDFDTFFNANLGEFDSAGPFQAIYGYDGSATNGWVVWNLATIADGAVTELIAPGQGFFVKSQAGGGLVDYTASMKRTGSSDDFIQGRNASPLDVALNKLSLTSATNTANTSIYFIEGTTRGLDAGYDAGSYGGAGEAGFLIYTNLVEENEGLDIAIQSLDYNDFNDVVIPVGVKASAGSALTIALENSSYSPIPANVNVYLEDTLENTMTLLNTSDYTFTPATDMFGTGRFFLRYSADTLSLNPNEALNELVIYTNENSKDIIIKGILTGATTSDLYDVQGRLVLSGTLEQSTLTNTIDVSSISSGVYIIKVSNNNSTKTQKLIIK